MDIQFEKSELMKKLEETNDISIIEAIKNIFKSEKKDFWDELTQEQKDEIEEGDRQIERGDFVDFEEFIQKYIE
jgi:predicted transcriptional regulator